MLELYMHPEFGHLYIPNKANSSHKPTFFSENNNPFSFKPTAVWVKISDKNISFSSLGSRYHSLAEIYFATRKIPQNFEGHDHWHG